MRPQSLHDLAHQVINGKDFNMSMKEFIDEVNLRRKQPEAEQRVAAMCTIEPQLTGVPLQDVFLAGVAEMLTGYANQWVLKPYRFLDEPIVFGGKHARGHVMQYTPIAMRKRMLFCGDFAI